MAALETVGAEQGDVEALGYKQELKRALSPFDLLVYGLVCIVPIAPWSSFGFVYNASNGMVPLVYFVGLKFQLGIQGVWVCLASELAVRGILFILRFQFGAWQKTRV